MDPMIEVPACVLAEMERKVAYLQEELRKANLHVRFLTDPQYRQMHAMRNQHAALGGQTDSSLGLGIF